MKLYFSQIDSSFSTFPKPIKTCLLIGSDNGQIAIGTKKIKKLFSKVNDNVDQIELDYSYIKEHPEVLSNELKSRQLFGENKIIVISGLTDSANKEFLELIDSRNDNNLLILQAQDVKKTSKLFKSQDKKNSVAIISCYKHDQYSLVQYISSFFAKNSIQHEGQLPEYISSVVNTDLLIIESELEKLITYCDGRKIVCKDVDNVIAETSLDVSLFDLCHSIVIKDKKLFSIQLSRIIFDNINFIMIVRVLQNYFLRLVNIKSRLSDGENIDNILRSLSPPVFFKDKDKLKYATSKITLEKAKILFKNFIKLEIDCKRINFNPQTLVYNSLMKYIN